MPSAESSTEPYAASDAGPEPRPCSGPLTPAAERPTTCPVVKQATATSQLQRPAWQLCASEHALPHAPQLRGSDWVSTHALSQPGASVQVAWHWPFSQTSPAAHLMPHPLQLRGSLSSTAHWPSHC